MAVAGASRGIGYAAALEFASEGARVSICSRNAAEVNASARTIADATTAEVHALEADVATAEGAARFVEESVAKMGGLQVLVVNSGGPPQAGAGDATERQWAAALEANFFSAVRMVHAALPHLRRREWGRIVCITSITVRQPLPGLVLSNAVRAATTGFAKSLSNEIAGEGITVNCVLPGYVLTDRVRTLRGAPPGAGEDDPVFSEVISRIPAGRLGSAEETAAAIVFLASRRASYINGVSLLVDGGFFRGLA